MKTTLNPYSTFTTILAACFTSGLVFASGTHATGHSHDSTEIGKPGLADAVTRTVSIDMSDSMRFTPANAEVRLGETVRFVIANSGKLKHEFVLGTEHTLKEHDALMRKFPGMEHSDPTMITLAGGQTGELIWHFTKPGKIGFACLQPGHFDAGMKGKITVQAD